MVLLVRLAGLRYAILSRVMPIPIHRPGLGLRSGALIGICNSNDRFRCIPRIRGRRSSSRMW